MLSPLLCAALALAAPADEPRDDSAFGMVMEIYPKSPLLGDVVFLKITAFNNGKEAVPVREWKWYGAFVATPTPTFQIGGRRRYRYSWSGIGNIYRIVAPSAPLPPGEKRVVFFGALELPPIGDIRLDFWIGLAEENGPVQIETPLGCQGSERRRPVAWSPFGGVESRRRFATSDERRRAVASFAKLRPRPPKEVAALLEAYAPGRPRDSDDREKAILDRLWLSMFPRGLTTPEKLAALESKLSDGSLRDILRVGRLLKIVVADKDHPRGEDQRRAALKELTDLLDASGELERQWLAYKVLRYFHDYNLLLERDAWPDNAWPDGGPMDEIERELVQALVQRLPEFLLCAAGPQRAFFWPFLKRKQKTEEAGTSAE